MHTTFLQLLGGTMHH